MAKTTASKPPTGSLPLPGSKRGVRGFISEVGRELKKVSWPARKETNRLTGVVLAVCAISLGLLFLLQEGFHMLITLLVEGF